MRDIMQTRLLAVFNQIMANKGLAPIATIGPATRLRQDLGFDSFDLAEMTVRIEDEFGVDVFADGLVQTVGEILAKLERKG
jgi:acyl carrier protein